MSAFFYALGDADNIRKRMQGFLLAGNLESLGEFSANLTKSIEEVGRLGKLHLNAAVIFSGGDDVLFRLERRDFTQSKLLEIMGNFADLSGATISFGVGSTTEEAFLNLARAKAIGPGTLFMGNAGSGESAGASG